MPRRGPALQSGIVARNRITRRQLAGLAGWAALRPAAAQSQFGSMLWEFIREYLRVLDERRASQLAALQSAEDFEGLRRRVRAQLLQMWGEFPERGSLEPSQLGTLDRGDHRIERIVFESRPRFHVTANLYRPARADGPLPAIVFPCGHAPNGKAAEAYQRFGILMARHGLAVLIWDPLGQGERLQFPHREKEGSSRFGSGTGEHRVLGIRCYMVGQNLMQYRVWDAIRALDYLESRPDIDSRRLAIAGQSGGGMTALQLACFEPRIRAAFISCAVASFRAKTEALLMADPEQILYGTLHSGIDHPELLAAFAPRPLMIGAALRDYVPIEGTRRTHAELEPVYAKLGSPGNLHLEETDAPHGLNRELRAAAAEFFVRALDAGTSTVREDEAQLPAPQQLRCTQTGQVSTALESVTVSDLVGARADSGLATLERPDDPSEFEIYSNEVADRIRRITRVGAYKAEFGIEVPTRFLDAGVYAKGAVFLVAEQGKDHPVVRRYCIDAVVAANHSLYGLDVRGWGATKPAALGAAPDFRWDDFLAYRSLELGRPLFGQRLKDLLATAPTMTKRREWIVAGIGIGGLLAAHAAVLDPRIAGVISIQAPLSYRAILDDPESTQPLSCVLPGVLTAYEIDDVYAALAPRPLLIANPQGSRQSALAPVQAERHAAWTLSAYEMLDAGGSVRVETGLGRSGIRDLIGEWLADVSS